MSQTESTIYRYVLFFAVIVWITIAVVVYAITGHYGLLLSVLSIVVTILAGIAGFILGLRSTGRQADGVNHPTE